MHGLLPSAQGQTPRWLKSLTMSSGTTCAIVPVKVLAHAKRRLSSVLPDAPRQRLVLAMLQDVLAALVGARSIDWVAVVTADQRVAALAQGHGASVLPEPGPGLRPESLAGSLPGSLPESLPGPLPGSLPEPLPEPLAAPLARSRQQPGSALNAAIASGLAYACSRGARRALVLPADVPLTTSRELESLVQSRGEQA